MISNENSTIISYLGLKMEKLKGFEELTFSLPVVQVILEPEKYLFFLTTTFKTGQLPEITEDEIKNIIYVIESNFGKQFHEVKKDVLKEIEENLLVMVSEFQLKNYLHFLEKKIEMFLSVSDDYLINMVESKVFEMEALSPIPGGMVDEFLSKDWYDEQQKELYSVVLKRAYCYNFSEKLTFKLLNKLYDVLYDYYQSFKDLKFKIELIKLERGLEETDPKAVKKDGVLLKNSVSNPTIFEEPLIRRLRSLFDDELWKKEHDLSDEGFLDYWRPGQKENYLPLLPGEIKAFMYLYFNFLNRNLTPEKRNGKFMIIDRITQDVFGIKYVKTERGRLNELAMEKRKNIKRKMNSLTFIGFNGDRVTNR